MRPPRPLFLALLGVVSGSACAAPAPAAPPVPGGRTVVVPPKDASSNYSPAVRGGNLVYLAGMVGMPPGSDTLVAGGVAAETSAALARIAATLEQAGLGLGDVVKCSVFLADMADYAVMNQAYRGVWPAEPPARTTVQATPPMGARVEIECIAAAR